jgi:hypothetical protein
MVVRREEDYFTAELIATWARLTGAPDWTRGRAMKPQHQIPLRRCGEFIGRASAGLIMVGTAGFALAAVMMDLL